MRASRLASVAPLAPLAAAAALVGAPAAAWAASGATVQSGWWNEAAVGPLAAPATTPSDQLQVSNGFSGPLAFAAVRVSAPSATPAGWAVTLTLTVPPGAATVGTPAVSACPTTGRWKPGADQKPSSAPGYSCRSGHQADGAAGNGVEKWTFPLSWGSGGTVSVALVPTPGTTSPFSVAYTAPTPASVTFGPEPAATAPVSSTPSNSPYPPGGSGSGSGSSPGAGSGLGSPVASGQPVSAPGAPGTPAPAGAFSAGATGPTSSPGGTGAPPSFGAVPAGAGGGAPGSQAAANPAGGSAGGAVAAPLAAAPGGGSAPGAGGDRAGRLMAFCLLVVTGLVLFFLSAQPDRAPRLLGPLTSRVRALTGTVSAAEPAPAAAGGPVRGVGRFARERNAPPRRL